MNLVSLNILNLLPSHCKFIVLFFFFFFDKLQYGYNILFDKIIHLSSGQNEIPNQ